MKFLKKMFKVSEMSVPGAMIASGILSGLIIGLSVFLTTWIFFGGTNNRQKLFISNPTVNRAPQANTLTPEQIKQLQEAQKQRMLQQQKAPAINPTTATTAPATKPATKK